MTPTPLVSVINRSLRVSDEDARRMTHAVAKQLADHVAPYHGLVPALELATYTEKAKGSPCYILDFPDVEGALGYHDEDEYGEPYIKVFANPVLDNGGTALKGSLSISAVLSHEIIELVGDGPANRWVDGPGGRDYSYELCDAVQDTFYDIEGVSVSNFLLQAFFDPKASRGSKLDYLGRLTKPFSMTSGGYQIVRTEPGRVSQIYGALRGLPKKQLEVRFGPDFPNWRKPSTKHKAERKRA